MKITASIVGLLFLYLSTHPVQYDQPKNSKPSMKMACCKKMTLKNQADKKGEEKQTENCSNGCNPFMPCPLNCYLTPDPVSYHLLYLPPQIINKNFTSFFMLPTYQSECWHPPQYYFNM